MPQYMLGWVRRELYVRRTPGFSAPSPRSVFNNASSRTISRTRAVSHSFEASVHPECASKNINRRALFRSIFCRVRRWVN